MGVQVLKCIEVFDFNACSEALCKQACASPPNRSSISSQPLHICLDTVRLATSQADRETACASNPPSIPFKLKLSPPYPPQIYICKYINRKTGGKQYLFPVFYPHEKQHSFSPSLYTSKYVQTYFCPFVLSSKKSARRAKNCVVLVKHIKYALERNTKEGENQPKPQKPEPQKPQPGKPGPEEKPQQENDKGLQRVKPPKKSPDSYVSIARYIVLAQGRYQDALILAPFRIYSGLVGRATRPSDTVSAYLRERRDY